MNTTDLMQMKNDNATKEVIEQSPKQLLNDFLYSIYYTIISVKQQRHWHKHLKKVYSHVRHWNSTAKFAFQCPIKFQIYNWFGLKFIFRKNLVW
jgi:hypothetical protein